MLQQSVSRQKSSQKDYKCISARLEQGNIFYLHLATLSVSQKYSKLPWDKNPGVCLVMSSKDSSCCSALFSQSWIITCTKLHLLLPLSSTSTHQSRLIRFSTKHWDPQYNWELVRFINILEQGHLSSGPRVLFSCAVNSLYVLNSMINEITTFTKPGWPKIFLRLYDSLKNPRGAPCSLNDSQLFSNPFIYSGMVRKTHWNIVLIKHI